MDSGSNQNPYSSNGINTTGASYPSPAAISPNQLQHASIQHTLPPLQHNASAMQSIYGSHPHTPRTPGTPNTPQPPNMSQYPPPNSGPTRGSYGMMPNQYQQPQQGYPTSSSMMPQTSVAASHPQPIAPAPAAARPPVLRPMPAGGVMPQTGLPSPYSGSPMMPHQQSLLQDNEQPTHVVGSQGRRGILPSAPGRPAAPTGSGASKNTVIPQKDADGKFPCPHCTKTYLHAKHLKRHLLRHTGDRPYMCVLCRDTFSRSDILKRHFQKCSIRRGNPTGVSHLSHPQAHVKKQQQNAQKANEGDLSHMNGMTNMPGDNVVHPFGMVQIQDGMGNMANDQNQLSRSSSMSRMDENGNRDRRSMTGGYNGDVSNSMSSNINPQLANFNMPQGQNGMPMYGASGSNQQSGLDWSQMFPQSGAHHAYVNQFPPNIGQNQTAIKTEPNLTSERPNGMPGMAPNDVNDRSLFFSNWDVQPSMQDPYHRLSSQILNFFHPPGTVPSSHTAGLNDFFSPVNIRDFLDSYIHFHFHFSFLHIPTFRIMEVYTGLIASMCCIGACYSGNAASSNVREMTNFLKIALERDCDLFSSEAQAGLKFGNGRDKRDIERLQALILMSSLLIWNGTPVQRESARRIFPLVADISRRFDLLQVRNDSSLYSIFHQPKISLEDLNPGQFDWAAWVEQETRIRVMHMIYLLDIARTLYFNCEPQFDSFEIRIPLPADDAVWEAQSAVDCAQGLNLYGSEAARRQNPDGSQRSKQPELNLTLAALFHSSYQIHPGSTNLYGKFILIHAIISQIRRAQLEGRLAALDGTSTPLSQNDWVIANGSDTGSGNPSANNSTTTTPVAGFSSQTYKTLCTALDKFKSYWDMDMAIQFPPSVSNPRRYGFCRDGIHFFWLAKWMLKNTSVVDLQLAPDSRFKQVIQLLKTVKSWVMTDGASRGEELGSVSDIDNDFAVTDLTLDMTHLFKPLPSVVKSPGMPAVKTEV
ncbi:fungal-specific transcription factor domain-containing protein [Daldinia caldariorum]|uniref:fungal-specific transcription factor domain-containing protein n=1 Tax=Daldinia caldariorum TaxID=326644 RepID=UPI0020089317|nr:fungal-specific transcription factor domain-containing protein [Daldinia caldariorum]KAI1470433.1 fungal-specific transcription factor domain-containing protein [Daldinia caldariorum]